MLPINLSKLFFGLPLALFLGGCGLTQSIADGTASTFNSIFYKDIKVLHLDFTARKELNTDKRENNSSSQSVLIRVYQLKDRKVFDKVTYQQLVKEGDTLLKEDLLAQELVVVKPGGAMNFDVPMNAETKFVAVAGLFRDPDIEENTWKLVIEREELDPDDARIVEAGANSLILKSTDSSGGNDAQGS